MKLKTKSQGTQIINQNGEEFSLARKLEHSLAGIHYVEEKLGHPLTALYSRSSTASGHMNYFVYCPELGVATSEEVEENILHSIVSACLDFVFEESPGKLDEYLKLAVAHTQNTLEGVDLELCQIPASQLGESGIEKQGAKRVTLPLDTFRHIVSEMLVQA